MPQYEKFEICKINSIKNRYSCLMISNSSVTLNGPKFFIGESEIGR